MKRDKTLLISMILTGAMMLTACDQSSDEKATVVAAKRPAQVYKLGLSLAITGPTSDAGNPYAKGVEDYCRYTNDMKLLGEDTVDCMIRDDQYKNEITKRNFEDFLGQGMVLYLNYSTGSTLGLKADFDEEKMPTIPASFHAGNLVDSHYIFLPITSYSGQVVGLAEYLVKNHRGPTPKVAMFIHPSAFGRAPVDDLKKVVAAGLKMDIVEIVEHGTDLDNTATLQRLINKGVRYVLAQTVQSPVASILNDAYRLGLVASTFGEVGKLTFMGAHYTGGADLVALAGNAAENFYWTTSYGLTTERTPGAKAQLELAKRYGRDDKAANSHNYTNGVMVAQIAVEAIRRVKAKDKDIDRFTLYDELNAMNGINSYYPVTTIGPVSYSPNDRMGVDSLQLYKVTDGVFRTVGAPFIPEYMDKIQ
jgi:branched-chain amino acid transport system substrate-binding protein